MGPETLKAERTVNFGGAEFVVRELPLLRIRSTLKTLAGSLPNGGTLAALKSDKQEDQVEMFSRLLDEAPDKLSEILRQAVDGVTADQCDKATVKEFIALLTAVIEVNSIGDAVKKVLGLMRGS